MCGVPYDQRIGVPPGLRVRAVHIDEQCGIRACAQEPGRLVGTPRLDGTHLVRLECTDGSGAVVFGEARLVISRDPRSLWRNLPSDRNQLHWKPDHAGTRVSCRGWQLQGLSRRGRSHANSAKCREDDMAVRVVHDRMIVMAVADGAGSASLARLGSAVAVEAAVRVLAAPSKDAPTMDSLRTSLAGAAVAAAQALQAAAAREGAALAALSTTLLLAVLVPEGLAPDGLVADGIVPGEVPVLACLQIGDGVIACSDRAGIRALAAADCGEYASQTRFVSAECVQPHELAARITVHALQAPCWILLASDGVTDPYLESEQALHDARCWAPIDGVIARAAAAPDCGSAEQLLSAWLDEFTAGHHDDRTLLLLLPTPAASGVLA
jgi:serine/threonine protein phosphatase PrpC